MNIPNLNRRAWEDYANRTGNPSFDGLFSYESNTPYSFTQQSGIGRTVSWLNEIGTFVQDHVRTSPSLRISLGLRFDWQTYFKSMHDFVLRLSVAHSTRDHKSIVRADSGVFYDSSAPNLSPILRDITEKFFLPSIPEIALTLKLYRIPHTAYRFCFKLSSKSDPDSVRRRNFVCHELWRRRGEGPDEGIRFTATYRGTIGTRSSAPGP